MTNIVNLQVWRWHIVPVTRNWLSPKSYPGGYFSTAKRYPGGWNRLIGEIQIVYPPHAKSIPRILFAIQKYATG